MIKSLTRATVPIHLTILGWGIAAAAIFVIAPEWYDLKLVSLALIFFGFLYAVVAAMLLVLKLGLPERMNAADGMTWGEIAMAVGGAALLAVVAFYAGGLPGRAMALAGPAVGALCSAFAVVALRRATRRDAA
ncbi:hypothetical protein BSZ36_08265 [Rubricoccus marinus]|uniref:Uncharacterized protein n=2 Tax=Rubricoccus marinus TaxID=716817 RepID=A0A259TZI0_9BACT|nr:hypothetical protein BSZ36_08265 [Rubricoccus marinus]